MDDREIIGLFFSRSEQAIAETEKKYGKVCKKIAENILHDPLDAEECVNDAFLGIWNAIPPEEPEHLPGYLFRIVRNLALKRYHADTAAKRNARYDVPLGELADCLPSLSSVEEEIEANELAAALDAFLGTLEKDSRILFVRRYWYSDTIEDLAKRFGIRKHTVSVRLSRLREKLKAFLQKEDIKV